MEAKAKVKVAKYTARSRARKAMYDQKQSYLSRRIVRAHDKLAMLHHLVLSEVGEQGIEKVYGSPFRDPLFVGDSPRDDEYDHLISELTLSPIDDETLDDTLTKLRKSARKTLEAWKQVELSKSQLDEVNERVDELYEQLLTKRSRIWIYFKMHGGYKYCGGAK